MATTPNIGSPAISTPRDFTLAGFQQALNNIRERFAKDEALLIQLNTLLNGSTSAKDITALQQQVAGLLAASKDSTSSSTVANSDDSDLTIAQHVFRKPDMPALPQAATVNVQDANLALAMRSLRQREYPVTSSTSTSTGTTDILATQIFGA